MYDRATEAWSLLFSVVKTMQQYGACKSMFMRLMWAAFCRFFRQMLIASKVLSQLPYHLCSSQMSIWSPSGLACCIVLCWAGCDCS